MLKKWTIYIIGKKRCHSLWIIILCKIITIEDHPHVIFFSALLYFGWSFDIPQALTQRTGFDCPMCVITSSYRSLFVRSTFLNLLIFLSIKTQYPLIIFHSLNYHLSIRFQSTCSSLSSTILVPPIGKEDGIAIFSRKRTWAIGFGFILDRLRFRFIVGFFVSVQT